MAAAGTTRPLIVVEVADGAIVPVPIRSGFGGGVPSQSQRTSTSCGPKSLAGALLRLALNTVPGGPVTGVRMSVVAVSAISVPRKSPQPSVPAEASSADGSQAPAAKIAVAENAMTAAAEIVALKANLRMAVHICGVRKA